MSTPTDSMLVASSIETGDAVSSLPARRSRIPGSFRPGTLLVSSMISSSSTSRLTSSARAITSNASRDVVMRHGHRTAKLAKAVVVHDQRPVRVKLVVVQTDLFDGLEENSRHVDNGGLHGVAGRHDAEVLTTTGLVIQGCEVRVRVPQAGWREERHFSSKEPSDLLRGVANRGCRGEDLGWRSSQRKHRLDSSLVHSGDGSQGSAQEVQLVLNHQRGRIEVRGTEQNAGFRFPGKPRKLVDGGHQHRRGRGIQSLVYDIDRQ